MVATKGRPLHHNAAIGVDILKMNSLVSVVIPTHNRPVLLRRAIRSVLSQSYHDLELIVVDDGADGTARAVCEEFRDSRIRYQGNQRAKGACGARNTGLCFAKGDYYTGLDDDDYFHVDRVRILLNAYRAEYAFVCSNTLELRSQTATPRFRGELMIGIRDILWSNCVGNQVLTEISKIRAVGGFGEHLHSQHDRDLWIRMIERWGAAKRLAQCLYVLDVTHGSPRITTSDRRLAGLQEFIRIHGDKLTIAQDRLARIRVKRCRKEAYILEGISALLCPASWEYLYKKTMRVW